MRMKSIIIFNEVNDKSFADELDVLDQVSYVSKYLNKLGYKVDQKGLTANYYNELKSIANDHYDLVFNLVESVYHADELIYFIPAVLDQFELHYTGCSTQAAFITGNKLISKQLMNYEGIKVPQLCRMGHVEDLKFGQSYILKPVKEDGSVGITSDSVMTYNGTVPSWFYSKDKRNWMLEEYIDGREFNISLIGGTPRVTVIPPAEIIFKNYTKLQAKIVSYEAKWNELSTEYTHTIRELHPEISPSLLDKLNEIGLKCWDLFDLHGYARIDVRVDENEEVYVMEVNANPCISADGGFVAACKEYYGSDTEIIKHIIEDLN